MIGRVNLSDLSRYRTELMGISAVLIMLCHSTAYIDMPLWFMYVLSLANIGVDFFLLLSGMGMWYSLSKLEHHICGGLMSKWGGVMKWYLVRYEKLFIPYLVTFVPIVLCQILMGNPPAHGFFDYVLYITSLRFYISHDAPWFVAALIPLYLLSPLFFVYMKKCRWLALTTISLLLWGIQLIPAITNSEVFDNFLLNLQFVSVRATCFVLGMALGQDIQNGVHLRTSVLVILVVIGVLVFALFKHLVYSYYFFSLPMLFLMVSILKRCKRYLVSVIRRIGEISLESYLFNLALPNIIVFLFILIGIQSLGNIMPYIIACVIGVVLGYISRKLSVKILEIVIK